MSVYVHKKKWRTPRNILFYLLKMFLLVTTNVTIYWIVCIINHVYYLQTEGARLESHESDINMYVNGVYDDDNVAVTSLTLLIPRDYIIYTHVTYICSIAVVKAKAKLQTLTREINISKSGIFYSYLFVCHLVFYAFHIFLTIWFSKTLNFKENLITRMYRINKK